MRTVELNKSQNAHTEKQKIIHMPSNKEIIIEVWNFDNDYEGEKSLQTQFSNNDAF